MRPKSLILLLLALGCGLVASIGISQVMERRNRDAAPTGETEAIFVAMKDINTGDPLNPQNIKMEEWPKGKVPAGAITKLEELEGRRTRVKLYPGEAIIEKKLISKEEGDVTELIPKGMRVVSVLADAVSSGGNLIRPGDRVDVLVFINHTGQGGVAEAGSKTILQDVKVFAVNEIYRRPEDKGSDAITAKTVSLLVKPQQAEKVQAASEIGKIRLVMRSSEDKETPETTGVSVGDILHSGDNSNRQQEEASANKGNNFLSMLQGKQGQQQIDPNLVAPTPGEHFKMEIISGNEGHHVEFTRADQTSRWEVQGNVSTLGDPNANPAAGGGPKLPPPPPSPLAPGGKMKNASTPPSAPPASALVGTGA